MATFENNNPDAPLRVKLAMLTGMVHELRAMLTTFLGYCEIEREKKNAEISDNFVAEITDVLRGSEHILSGISKARLEQDVNQYKDLCKQAENLFLDLKKISDAIKLFPSSETSKLKNIILLIDELYSIDRPPPLS